MFEDAKRRFRSFTNFINPRSQPNVPSYGKGLSGLAKRAVDVVSPNTAQDVARRQAAGQAASFAQQQAQRNAAAARVQALKPTQRVTSFAAQPSAGPKPVSQTQPYRPISVAQQYNKQPIQTSKTDPVGDFLYNFTKRPRRALNLAVQGVGAVKDLEKITSESIFGTDQSYQQALNQAAARQKSGLQGPGIFKSGVLNFAKDPGFSKGPLTKQAYKEIFQTGTDIAQFIPVAGGIQKGVSLGAQLPKVILKNATEGAITSGLARFGSQLGQNKPINKKEILTDTALGGLISGAAPILGAAFSKKPLSKDVINSLKETKSAPGIIRIAQKEGLGLSDQEIENLAKATTTREVEKTVTEVLDREASKIAQAAKSQAAQVPLPGATTAASRQFNDNLVTELQRTTSPQQTQDTVRALFRDIPTAEQSRIATELANTKDAAAIRKTLEDAQTRRTAVTASIQQATPTAPVRQADAIEQAAEAPAIAAPTPTGGLPEAQIAEVPAAGPITVYSSGEKGGTNFATPDLDFSKTEFGGAGKVTETRTINPTEYLDTRNSEQRAQLEAFLGKDRVDEFIGRTDNGLPAHTERGEEDALRQASDALGYKGIVISETDKLFKYDGREVVTYADNPQKTGEDWYQRVAGEIRPARQQTGEAALAQPSKDLARTNLYPDDIPLAITNKQTATAQFMTAFNDKDSAIINYLKSVERETGQTGLVDQFYIDSGLLSRSNSIANAQVVASDNLRQAFEGLTGADKNAFDNYVAIRNEIANAERGLKTAVPLNELRTQEAQLAGQFGDRFASLNNYYKEWATQMKDAGLIGKDTFNQFVSNNDYTRIQRVMDDLAKPPAAGGKSFSLRTSLAKQKRIGSLREIQPADITAFDYAQRVQKEIQRNQVSSNLIDVLLDQKVARPIPAAQAARKNVMARIVDGKTELFEVPKDIKELVDNISPYQLGILQQVISAPNRLFKAGTTTLNPVFTATNYGKDQLSLAVFGRNFKATHNPVNMVTALFEATKDFGGTASDPLWQKFISVAGDTTQFDLLRNVQSAKGLSREIRLGKVGKGIEKVRNPIRTLENLNSITEKATRFQNFKGVYSDVLKKTGNETQALQTATLAAWQDTVDFNRAGNVAQAINLVLPYFNASIQGTRLIGRSFVDRPGATTGKVLSFVALPLAALTLHNLSDPETRKIYENISDYEKENNFIIVLPNAKQNKDGSYDGVIKIPIQQGLSNLVQPFRMSAENYAKTSDQNTVKEMAQEFIGAFSGPVDTTNLKSALGAAIPQALKPALQQKFNVDLYTGKPIVPEYIEQATNAAGEPVPEAQKAYDYSSGTARKIGERLGWSPIRIEKFIKDTTGKVGLYVLNASDNLLAKKGIISDDQIGGLSMKEDFTKRLFKAQGEYNFMKPASGKFFDARAAAVKSLNKNEKSAYEALHPDKTNFLGEKIFDENKRLGANVRAGVYLQFPKVFEADKAIEMEMRKQGNPANPIYDLTKEQLTRVLLKATLPPGAKDPELSKLYEQEWYQDYQANRGKYYEAVKAKFQAEGKTLPVSPNPYPTTPADVQGAMDYYSSLPKGTGQRSGFIKSYPDVWAKMTGQWAAVDAWENKERVAMGLSATEGFQATGQTGGFGGFGSGSGGPKDQRQYLSTLLSGGLQLAEAPQIKTTPTRFKLKVQKPTKGRKARIRLG